MAKASSSNRQCLIISSPAVLHALRGDELFLSRQLFLARDGYLVEIDGEYHVRVSDVPIDFYEREREGGYATFTFQTVSTSMFDFVDDLFRRGHVWISRVLDQRNDMIIDLVECIHVVHGVR